MGNSSALCGSADTAVARQLATGPPCPHIQPNLALQAREYGSGREALGLPPLPGGGGGAATASAPKLSDYLLFGDLMGEKPEEVQRQLALNNAEVEVDDAAVALLRE